MKLNIHNFKYIAIFIIFLLGLYYCVNSEKVYENLENKNHRCPNMLIEKDGAIFLYNSKIASVPGVNPIQFKNLEEYSDFVDWQNSQGINCPVLYLQYTTDTQNNDLIQVKPSIFENQGGLPNQQSNTLITEHDDEYYEENKMLDATKDSDKKYNTGMYSGFDRENQNVGLDTPLDKLYHEKSGKSANPMDPNWGGKEYTKLKIDQGAYKDRYVTKR
tara:strand:+ start:1408 stop:2058 length:651 start_codon:yes stop_codon:yes gene_type:complete